MIDRFQVTRYRFGAQQLDRERGTVADTAILDFGVQDTGPDGALWALAIRGVDVASLDPDDLVYLWTVRGAPHCYRRSHLGQVAAAVSPYSETDASRRIYDAARSLKAAGIPSLEALDAVAEQMRAIVAKPLVKGEVSTRLTPTLPEPYRRFCRPCNAVHLYEMTFRLGAVRAGIELEPSTSPPVMRPIPEFRRADAYEGRFDLVRGYLHFLGPATVKETAEFIDAPVRDIKAHWPEDAVEVTVDGQQRWMLEDDVDALRTAEARGTRLLGPYDLFLQGRDRATLVSDPDRAKQLWPVLGRPGAVLIDGQVAALWRPRKSGKQFKVSVEPWRKLSDAERKTVTAGAERLAEFRGIALTGMDFEN